MAVAESDQRPILLVHNRYQQPGGEDVMFETDAATLERRGQRVLRYERSNDEIAAYGPLERARLAVDTTWSVRTHRELRRLLRDERPAVAHFYNTFPLVSPSALAACHRAGVPVVLSVANFRLTCANAYLYRDRHVCRDCVGRPVKWPAVWHRCYHDSAAESAVVAAMITVHGAIGTWRRKVDLLVAMSDAVKDVIVAAGWPDELVVVRYSAVEPDPGPRPEGPDEGYLLFAGRLSPEKNVATLLRAAARVPDVPVRIVGDGPDRAMLEDQARAAGLGNVVFLGRRPRDEVLALMKRARALLVPSAWYEPFGYVVVEAFACGLPVIASDLGALPELVDASVGRIFPSNDDEALAAALRWAADHPEVLAPMGRAARARFEASFTSDAGYASLVAVHELAQQRFAARTTAVAGARLRRPA
jgi:glycosyltransferase involved in cell wall biosynthesis